MQQQLGTVGAAFAMIAVTTFKTVRDFWESSGFTPEMALESTQVYGRHDGDYITTAHKGTVTRVRIWESASASWRFFGR